MCSGAPSRDSLFTPTKNETHGRLCLRYCHCHCHCHPHPPPGLVGADRQHVRLHGVLHGVDDVRRHRHPAEEDAGPQRHRIRSADGHAGAHRLADPRAAGHLDRQVRRPPRDDGADGRHGARHLVHVLRHGLLALSGHRPLRGPGRWLVFGRHALRGTLVPEEPPGHGDGCLRRRQFGLGGQQVRGPICPTTCCSACSVFTPTPSRSTARTSGCWWTTASTR